MLITVFTANISHKHGNDIRVAGTKDGINKLVANYCRECWDDVDIASAYPEPPEDDLDCITAYFDSMDDEWCEIEQAGLDTSDILEFQEIIERRDVLEQFRANVASNGTTEDLFEVDQACDALYKDVEELESDLDDDTLCARSYSLNQCIKDARDLGAN